VTCRTDRKSTSSLAFRLLAAIALAAAQPATAADPTRLEISAADLEEARQDWYGIYSGESKLGYMHNTLRLEPSSGRYVVENSMHLKVVTLGEKREVQSTERLEFAAEAPYGLIRGVGTVLQGQYSQEVEISRSEVGFEAHIRAAGGERSMEVPDLDYTLADILTAELWFRAGRSPGESVSVRSFSLTDLTQALDTYSVEGLKETLADGVSVSYYEVDLHSSVAGSIGTALIDERGQLVSGVLGGAFELRRESAALAPDFDYAADVYLLGLAQVDTRLGDPRSVTALRMEVEGREPQAIPSFSHQSLHFDEESGAWILTIADGAGEPQIARTNDIARALEETVEHPIRDPRIVEMARQAVGEAEDTAAQVEALVRFVDGFLEDSYSAEPLTVLDMLSTPKGDCTEHALLFSTLARSLDIPAREVTGLLYLGDDVQAFGGHAWNEVVIDGQWTPVDATWGETRLNATHVRLGTRLGDDTSLAGLFANYSFKVLEIERQ